ncbi:MAG: hypothetical protein ACM31L_15010 [Actinomycetota bacterium]
MDVTSTAATAMAMQGASGYATQSLQAIKEQLQAQQAIAQVVSQATQQQEQQNQLAAAGNGKGQMLDISV